MIFLPLLKTLNSQLRLLLKLHLKNKSVISNVDLSSSQKYFQSQDDFFAAFDTGSTQQPSNPVKQEANLFEEAFGGGGGAAQMTVRDIHSSYG
jgi:hypothetical protein